MVRLGNKIFALTSQGLPKFPEVNVSVAARTTAGLGPESLPIAPNFFENGQQCTIAYSQLDRHVATSVTAHFRGPFSMKSRSGK